MWLALQKGTRGDPVATLTVEEVFEPGRRGGTNDGDRLPRLRGLRMGAASTAASSALTSIYSM